MLLLACGLLQQHFSKLEQKNQGMSNTVCTKLLQLDLRREELNTRQSPATQNFCGAGSIYGTDRAAGCVGETRECDLNLKFTVT